MAEALAKIKDGSLMNCNVGDVDGSLLTLLIEALTAGAQLNVGQKGRTTHTPTNYSLGPDGQVVDGHLNGIDTAFGSLAASPHALGGASHSSATLAQLNALVSNATLDDQGSSRPPQSHKNTHKSAGSDPFASTDLLEAVVKRLRVTGPVTLLVGAVSDGQYLKRSGTAIVGDAPTAVGTIPVGGIVAWHKSFPNTPALPVQFVECNGQTLSDGDSPYNGQVIPDLNGDGRFLRGSATSGTNQAQGTKKPTASFETGDQSASHTHVTYIGAKASGGRSADHTHLTVNTNNLAHRVGAPGGNLDNWFADFAGSPTTGGASVDHTHSHTHGNKTSGNQSASHTHYVTGGGDAETRPVNMSVVWVMRIK